MRKRTIALSLVTLLALFFFVQAVSQEKPYEYRGFRATKVHNLTDANCTLIELEHTATGVQVMHVQNDDPENMFALCFRTPPTDSSGAAHILEHSVLQGSEKYPVKGAFYHLLKRTFATLINAFTGPEYTVYPAATLVRDDFYNLLAAYTDACFHPLLTKSTFLQEGYRLEFETFDDPTTPLIYNGVVYNEMKGYFSNPRLHLFWTIWEKLFPVTRGNAISGGDPRVIPELTYEQFVQFHKSHYYPENCLFYFYGNLPLEGHLDFLLDNVLNTNGPKKLPVAKRALEPRFIAPTYSEGFYPASHEEAASSDKALMGLAWLTLPSNSDDIMALRIINHILMATDASPLKHEILSSGLCKQVGVSLDDHLAPFVYYYIFEGCSDTKAKELEEFVLKALERIVETGLSTDMIEQAIGRFELEERELKQGHGSLGALYIDSIALAKLNGLHPEDTFLLTKHLSTLRANIAKDPKYLSRCIQKQLLDNTHRVCVVLKPSKELAESDARRDREKLDAIRKTLTEDQVEEIIVNAREFRKANNDVSAEKVSLLPTVTLDSVSKDVPEYPVTRARDIIHYETFTNHITYASCLYPLPQIPLEDMWAVGLYSYLLPQLGNDKRSYRDNLSYINEHTGGVKVDLGFRRTSK